MPESSAPETRVIIRISALPDSALRRALTGTTDAARKASKQVADATRKGAKEGQEARVAADRVAERSAKQVEDAKLHAAARSLRVAERLAAAERREAQKTARTQIRESEKAAAASTRVAKAASEERRRLMLGIGAGAWGAARGASQLVGRGQGLAGVSSLEDRLSTAGDFRAQLIRTAGEAKVSPEERAKVEANLLKVSEDTNVALMDLVGGLATAQTRFDKFRDFTGTIGDIAKVSQATGESLDDLVGAIGTASQVFQLDEAGQRDFIDALIATSERGTIGVGDFARNLAGSMGSFQVATHRTGAAAAREFLATSQVLGTSQVGAAETGTMMERFMSEISLPATQKKLAQIGVRVKGDDGQLLNVGDIGQQLLANKRFQNEAGVRQAIFPEIRAMRGAEFLTAELGRNPEAFTSLQNISATEGARSIDQRFAELSADPLFKLRNVGVRAQTDTVRDADRIVQTITPAITELTRLQTKFPLLTESVDTLESTVRWAAGTLLADKLLRGGGGGAAFGVEAGEALGKTASVSLGKAFSDAGWAGKVGMAGQVMATGFLAYMTTRQILQSTGWDGAIESFGGKVWEFFHGEPDRHASRRGTGPKTTTAAKDAAARAAADAEALNLPPIGGWSMLPPENPILSPMIPPAEATLTIKVEGPGKVTGVRSIGFGMIETETLDTGRRDSLPP
jgi:hypothetical protein